MNIQKFDLNLLRVFDALMTARNVSLAGARIGLSQPSVSNALARLRALCDDPLFVRTSRGVQPTTYAEELALPVRQALSLVTSALQTSNRFDPATARRRFTLVLSDIGEAIFVPPLIKEVRRSAPGVDVRILQLPRDEIPAALETGLVDLAIGRLADVLRGHFSQRLFADSYVCVMRKDHPLARHKRLSSHTYEAAAHVVAAPPNYRETQLEHALVEKRLKRRVQLQVPHYFVIPRILRETDLIATLPERVIKTLADPAQFKVFRPPVEIGQVEVHQFWHSRFHHDAGNRWLRSIFARHFPGSAF
ncbi:MAG: LysR family transcriptional regulator [Burkholderiales bacterium]